MFMLHRRLLNEVPNGLKQKGNMIDIGINYKAKRQRDYHMSQDRDICCQRLVQFELPTFHCDDVCSH